MHKSKNLFIQTFQEIWQYRDLLKQLVTRDIKLKYRRSFLGYVWSVLNPLLVRYRCCRADYAHVRQERHEDPSLSQKTEHHLRSAYER